MPSVTGEGVAEGTIDHVLTYSFTNTAGTILYVGVGWGKRGDLGGDHTVGSVTYNGVAMSALITRSGDSTKAGAAIYRLVTPATGANNVVITMVTGNTASTTAVHSGAISFTGQHATPEVAASTASDVVEGGGSSTNALTTGGATTSGNYALWMSTCGASFTSVDKTETWRKNINTNSAGGNGSMAYAAGTGSTITCTFSHGGDWSQIVCVEVQAAAGAAGASQLDRRRKRTAYPRHLMR
jgi:hypothetical protein